MGEMGQKNSPLSQLSEPGWDPGLYGKAVSWQRQTPSSRPATGGGRGGPVFPGEAGVGAVVCLRMFHQ